MCLAITVGLLTAAFAASHSNTHTNPRLPSCRSMIIAGTAFLIGSVFQAAAKSTIALLFIGRVFWGIGKCSSAQLRVFPCTLS